MELASPDLPVGRATRYGIGIPRGGPYQRTGTFNRGIPGAAFRRFSGHS